MPIGSTLTAQPDSGRTASRSRACDDARSDSAPVRLIRDSHCRGLWHAWTGDRGRLHARERGTGPVSGPSELGLSLALTASPDALPLDGVSQTLIGIFARDRNARALSNLRLSLQIATSRGFEDFGRLSTRSAVTGSDGRATVTYTVPLVPSNAEGAADVGMTVTVWVTPIGQDYGNEISRGVTIRLVRLGRSSRCLRPPLDSPSLPRSRQSLTRFASVRTARTRPVLTACETQVRSSRSTIGTLVMARWRAVRPSLTYMRWPEPMSSG